jgi:hypothetical protein
MRGISDSLPDEQTVQVGIGPLLALPPVVHLTLLLGLAHRVSRSGLSDDS